MSDQSTEQNRSGADLGQRLRTARRERGVSLQDVADESGLSKSFISQVELGRSAASLGTLKRICAVLDMPIWPLLDDDTGLAADDVGPDSDGGHVVIVRHDERKVRRYPGSSTDIAMLTPDLRRKIQATMSVVQPGEGYGHESYTHRGEEFGLVLSGTYEVTVDGVAYVLEKGDSIYFTSTLPHRTRAMGDEPVRSFWVATLSS